MFRRILFPLAVIFVIAATVLFICVAGCGQQQTRNEARKAYVLRVIDEAWSKGNLAVLDEHFAANFTRQKPPDPVISGLEAFKKHLAGLHEAWSDVQIAVEGTAIDGDTVAAWTTIKGTNKKTGQDVTFKGCFLYFWEGDHIVKEVLFHDDLGMYQQLGYTILPPVTENTFARVTVVRVKPEKIEESLKIYRESVVPAVKIQKGFRGIFDLSDSKTGRGLSISIWDSEADAIANEQSGVYKEQLDKFKGLLTAQPIREGYTVAVQE